MKYYLAILALLSAGASAAPGGLTLSAKTVEQLSSLEAKISATATGRRLLAETVAVPRLESAASGAPIRYLRDPSVIAFDPKRMSYLSEWEVELELVRELARASLDIPLEMPEGEMAAYRTEMIYGLERTARDPEFDAWLRKSYSLMGRRHQARQTIDLKSPARVGVVKEAPLASPRNEIDRIGYFMYLFLQGPDEFYWAVEWGLPFGPDAVKWSEVQDFLDRHGDAAAQLAVPPDAEYVRLGGRRYDAGLVRAARYLASSGQRPRVAKALAPLEDDGACQSLRSKIRDWTKSKGD